MSTRATCVKSRRCSRLFQAVVGYTLVVCLAETPRIAGAAFELDDSFLADAGGVGPAYLSGRHCLRWQLSHRVPFGLRELGVHQLAAAISRPGWGLATGLSRRGPGRHRETSTWLGGGLSPVSRLAVGAGIHLLQLRQENLPPVRAFAISAGVRLKVASSLGLGVWLRGPAGSLAPARLLVGFTRILDDQSTLAAYLTRREGRGRPHRFQLGAATPIRPGLWLLLGVRSAPIQFTGGSRFEAGAHFLEYRIDTHAVLGPSHSARVGRLCGPAL